MSMRNAMLANELAKVLLPDGHVKFMADPEHPHSASFKRVLSNVEGCLAAHNKTNFTDVCAFNTLIGNDFGGARSDARALRRQFELIRSELNELDTAIRHLELLEDGEYTPEELGGIGYSPFVEVRDGIADVLVTTYGLAHRMGIDADKDMLAVSASNASKFFVGTEEQAAEVCKALADSLGIKVESRYAMDVELQPVGADESKDTAVWAFVSADDSDPERPRGKLLKAPGYKPPVFE